MSGGGGGGYAEGRGGGCDGEGRGGGPGGHSKHLHKKQQKSKDRRDRKVFMKIEEKTKFDSKIR